MIVKSLRKAKARATSSVMLVPVVLAASLVGNQLNAGMCQVSCDGSWKTDPATCYWELCQCDAECFYGCDPRAWINCTGNCDPCYFC